MQTPSHLPLLHWLTELSLNADGAKSLSIRVFQDETVGNLLGHLADQCVHLRTHILATRCTREQQDRFWQQRIIAIYHPLPETYLFHHTELEPLRLKMASRPPLYKVRLLGKNFDLFYDLSSFETATFFKAHDKELYETGAKSLFDAYYTIRNAIKGDQPKDWDEIHDALDMAASTRSLAWKDRWQYFAEGAHNEPLR